ncbi:MAG: hypothetical protein RLZZ336_1480 [Cyanobacteriota bacterium]|jgi:hypothetical protein
MIGSMNTDVPGPPSDLWIANTVSDLVQGDVREHLPLERIPLRGDVLGLGTTTSLDNGELSFLLKGDGNTSIWKGQAHDGGIRELQPGDGSGHFPYVCFSRDATDLRRPVDLTLLGPSRGRPLQELVGEAIALLRSRGELVEAPIYGLRLMARWQSLIITVASKLCMGQQRRNNHGASGGNPSVYDLLQHYRLAEADPGNSNDPIRYLGRSLQWDCCGFWDSDPAQGRVTVPVATDHLHLHGCSTDLRHGGHLHHGHPQTALLELERLTLYPLQRLQHLGSDLAVENLSYENGEIRFTVVNRGTMDVSDVGVAVVIDDCYSSHRYLRLPWLEAGAMEHFAVPLPLTASNRRVEVIADPERDILEQPDQQANNRAVLNLKPA